MTDIYSSQEPNAHLLRPNARVGLFGNPDELLDHPSISVTEKHALLKSSASYANALPGVASQSLDLDDTNIASKGKPHRVLAGPV